MMFWLYAILTKNIEISTRQQFQWRSELSVIKRTAHRNYLPVRQNTLVALTVDKLAKIANPIIAAVLK